MGYGIGVVLVMNRKGGSGKSTLGRALASAAAARGETVTIFDTDSSKSCLKWMQLGTISVGQAAWAETRTAGHAPTDSKEGGCVDDCVCGQDSSS